MTKRLSIAIATHNEEKNIGKCLLSVTQIADEIVVVDGNSKDETVSIVKKYTTNIYFSDNPPIFHINKQKAVAKCSGDWIFQLDADEMIPQELAQEIKTIINTSKAKVNGFFIPRKNYFLGHWMRKGGQYPDYVMRLFRRGKGKFPCKSVHEQIEIEGETGYLKHDLMHYSYSSLSLYWEKAYRYINLLAEDMRTSHIKAGAYTAIYYMIWKPIQIFILLFIRHKGFMDSFFGLLYAVFSALHYPIAYFRYIRGLKNSKAT